MKVKPRLKRMIVGLVVLAGVAALGWVSNARSKTACQQQVGSWLLTTLSANRQTFYLIDPNNDPSVSKTFQALDASFQLLAPKHNESNAWPRLSMKTRALIPFFIAVDYAWEREPELGSGGTRWFFGLFGKIFQLGDTNLFAT